MEKKISLTVSMNPIGTSGERAWFTHASERGSQGGAAQPPCSTVDHNLPGSMAHEPSLRRGALLMLVSAFFFAAMGLAVKLASRSLSNSAVVFFRNAVGLITLLPWLGRLGVRNLATRDVRGHLVRSLAGLASMYCFFYAIAHLRLADAVLLNYSLPLFMPFLAGVWLGERIPPGLWRGLGIGLAGIALTLRPGMGPFIPMALVALAAALLPARAQGGVRTLRVTKPATRIV